jgi:hypothetical protein
MQKGSIILVLFINPQLARKVITTMNRILDFVNIIIDNDHDSRKREVNVIKLRYLN